MAISDTIAGSDSIAHPPIVSLQAMLSVKELKQKFWIKEKPPVFVEKPGAYF